MVFHIVLLQQLGDGLHHGVGGARLGRGLVDGVVADEIALAVVDDAELADEARLPVGVVARDFLKGGGCCQRERERERKRKRKRERETGTYDDVVPLRVEVVADVLGKGALLVAPTVPPLPAAGVPLLAGAFLPGGHHVVGVREVLEHHDARVQHDLALAVHADVVAVLHDLLRVDGATSKNGTRLCELVPPPPAGASDRREG